MKITNILSAYTVIFLICCSSISFAKKVFTQNDWEQISGSARTLSVGAGGHIYIIGKEQTVGGYKVYKWGGDHWKKMNIGGLRIAVAKGGTPWVIQNNGSIYHAQGKSWKKIPGQARDIGIGANGDVWIVGWDRQSSSGYGIYKWNKTHQKWTLVPGKGYRIAVAAGGTPWLLTEQGKIFQRVNNVWEEMPGKARNIGIGENGSIWILGYSPLTNGEHAIYKWNKTQAKWDKYEGGGSQISVASDGTPWVVDRSGKIWRKSGSSIKVGEKLNPTYFNELIKSQVQDKVKGYAFVLANKDGIQTKIAGGWAQDPRDGNVPMTPSISSGLGSISKVLTGMALLHLFEQKKFSNRTLEEQLDYKMWFQLPRKWHACLGKNIKEITYRHLLQHRSGFPKEFDGKGWCDFLRQGVSDKKIGSNSYSNFNFSIFNYLLPAIAYPEQCRQLHERYQHLSSNEYEKEVKYAYNEMYLQIMDDVFQRTIRKINPVYHPSTQLNESNYAKSYSDKDDWSGDVREYRSRYCAPQGSWYMSAEELAIFARSYGFFNTIISNEAQELVFDPKNWRKKLIYNKTIFKSEFGLDMEVMASRWASHGGSAGGFRTAIIHLPYGYYGVGLINSPEISSTRIAKIILDSFYEATRTVKWHNNFSFYNEIPLSGDFNGDGKTDIITFTQDREGDVFVALSDGEKFNGVGWKWHDQFCFENEIPKIGDFNGDGKDDIAVFNRGNQGDVFVALSNGEKFEGIGVKWHDWFCMGDEIPEVGDFNGDGKDDIAVFNRGNQGDVFVALSNGNRFEGTGWKWHDHFCLGNELPKIGDFNGDGKDDIAAFTRGSTGDVFVALSRGNSFQGTGWKWHDWFCIGNEFPLSGQFNGSGAEDLVCFTRGQAGDTYITTSVGERFAGNGIKLYGNFCLLNELPVAGDFNGDGLDDLAVFNRGNKGDVYVALTQVQSDLNSADYTKSPNFPVNAKGILRERASIFVSPNPITSTSIFAIELPQQGSVELSILDSKGSLIKTIYESNSKEAGNHKLKFDRGDFSSGIYFVKFRTEEEIILEKIIIH